MNTAITAELINNVALLLALSLVFEVSYIIPVKWAETVPVFSGLLIGLIGLAIMLLPLQLDKGIYFDTRSVLISITALTFDLVPTVVASFFLIVYRVISGGAGLWMGISVILSSACIGIIWKRFLLPKNKKYRWLNIYLFGIVVHLFMLADTSFLPREKSLHILHEICMPVMLIYPIGTVLLSLLLLHQKERYESVNRLMEAEERYRSMFNNSHGAMLLIDPESGRIVDANPAAARFYGWTTEELKSMTVSQINILSPEEIKNEMKEAVSERRNHFMFRHKRASGELAEVEIYSGPIQFRGKVLIYSIIHDISERSAANRALQESENRFRLLVESAPEAIFIETAGRFSYINQFAVSLFGADSAEQLIDSPVLDRFHPEYHDVIKGRISILSKEKRSVPANEEVFLKMDGSPVEVEVSAVPIHYNELDGALVFARDITERKILERKKNEIEAQLRQQQKLEAIGTLAGGVAHEINNPINGIMNYAQLILDDEADKDSARAGYAGEIIRETNRVAGIVKNLLQFSRQEKQSHSYADVYDVIDQTVSLIKTIVKVDQISLIVDLDENLPAIKCRSQQIQQVLMNLLTNARDTLNEKYPGYHEDKIIRIQCSQYMDDGRRWIRVTVEDHGKGIPPELRDKIFEPFFSTKPKEIGTGLGLSISFGIVQDHHGKIAFETKEGCFTKFVLDLPVDNGWNL